MDYFIERLIDGLTLGAICAVLAVSYAIAGRVRRLLILVNTTGYLTAVAITLAVFSGTPATGINPAELPASVLALTCAVLVSAIAALSTTEALPAGFKPTSHPHSLMIATGVFFIAAGMLQAADQLRVPHYLLPRFAPRLTLFIPGILPVQFAFAQPVILATGAAALAVILGVFRYGSIGRKQRAVAQDRLVAELLGIDVARTISIAIIIASMAAALSGWMATVDLRPADTGNALLLAICAFLGAVVGGLRSLPKAAAGGFAVGLGDAFWSGYFGPQYAWPAILAVLVFVLIFSRPALATAAAIGEV